MFSDAGITRRRASVDMSPLIDIVFLLLIFFAVTTTFLEQSGMDLELPQSSTAEASENTPILVELSATGEIRFEGEVVTAAELQARVTGLDEGDRARVTIRADRAATLDTWVEVIDALRNGGVGAISMPMLPREQ